mgnify:CR=1 FL=1|tara:strand:- start:10213 stop:11229 length:1017 start_codon:yes stop_codon:yes gene_type:complete
MKEIEDIKYYKDSINFILEIQSKDGAICWEKNAKLDPWDHVESAMALTVAGEESAARMAYRWMQRNQVKEGGWYSEYKSGVPTKKRIETNFAAYLAVGLWHYYLITQDKEFLEELFPVLNKAMLFVESMQTEHGDVLWALNEEGSKLDDSLVTGCSSIYKSFDCFYSIKSLLNKDPSNLKEIMNSLKQALIKKPERFDRGWKSKDRYSMDWYYPILCRVFTGKPAEERFENREKEFIVDGMGCKCVVEEPWVTIAESSELVMALAAMGKLDRAKEIFSWLHQWKDSKDNLYWTGYVYPDKAFWPIEKPTWTAAAVLLAADTLYKFTDGSELFIRDWSE